MHVTGFCAILICDQSAGLVSSDAMWRCIGGGGGSGGELPWNVSCRKAGVKHCYKLQERGSSSVAKEGEVFVEIGG